ncbi:MAG: hypothetical protein K1X79_08710 [Oligoflexia bacterium]|nr:hypothetical protein [Oligoflexia bacterium]
MKLVIQFGLILGLALWVNELSAFAHDGHEHQDGQAAAEQDMTSQSMESILVNIKGAETEFDSVIAQGKLADVHHIAYRIRDLAAALPAKVDESRRARVAGTAKNIASVASALDASGDKGDQSATQSNASKMRALLALLEKQVK